MIEDKSVLVIIPARSGSKGLPGKNIKEFCGKPLIAWSINTAKKSKYADELIVSTDSQEIASIAAQYGSPVPFMRPAELATDTSTSYDVIRHALGYMESAGSKFDIVVLLEPTSPIRKDEDVDCMLEVLAQNYDDCDAIVSVGEVMEHPSIMKAIDGPYLEPFWSGSLQTNRRQDNVPAYFPYGVAYISKTDVLLRENTFYSRRCTHYVIEPFQNYEIDDLYGFLCAERIMEHHLGLKK